MNFYINGFGMRQLCIMLLLCLCAGSGCGRKHTGEAAGKVAIERFDVDIVGFQGLDSVSKENFKAKYGPVIDFLLPALSVSDTNNINLDSLIAVYANSRGVAVFEPDVMRLLPNLDSLERSIGMAKAVSRNIFPDIVWPNRLIGIVSTYNQSMIFNDSVLLVGLNHYLGREYAGYGYFEPYQRRFKDSGQLPVRLMESVIVKNYPYRNSSEPTALSKMLYDGAVLWGIKQALSLPDDTLLMGWTAEQKMWVDNNLEKVWHKMVENKLLFSTDPSVADRLTRVAPSASLVHPEAPGRIGSYLGLLIVSRFLDNNPKAEPRQMLDSAMYNSLSTLVKSGFAP
ncbi:hypothetical protein [uncultured Muribaculum sp.]|uniref:gliding motility protein GldB-related protein n=1 Tax=uncultured Muribaculum sp. TaxID=1918613 RepID=UPI0025B128F1|nr:hypothetical protein [uncultured Muribaculum sp.]